MTSEHWDFGETGDSVGVPLYPPPSAPTRQMFLGEKTHPYNGGVKTLLSVVCNRPGVYQMGP